MQDLTSFVSENSDAITAGVAVIALVQPWLIAVYKRFLRPGHVKIYETGRIEIGYSNFGPTIALAGTLKASHRDFFIRRIRATVIKEKDHSQHVFEWCLFRSQKVTYGSTGKGEETAVELPFSFMLMYSQPHPYNIVFNDQSRLDEVKQVLSPVFPAWYEYYQHSISQDQDAHTLYKSFMSSQPHLAAYKSLNKLNYWEHSTYKLRITVETESGSSFHTDTAFTLSDEDSRNLEFNTIVILEEVCGQSNFKYQFAYPSYQNKATKSAT